ncbi:hypothetical protein L915_07274 [Phytophthora nicotianae]|uniref:Uncharacterized protein n=3 Tax=Phytophthora nicotianae TaxID=4792 RepID=W2H013_PHYNI|nr:hypothetical protein L915_07274 [Phytophthora nicotianae]
MARTSDGNSAGRLLRVLGDCELFHMEAAMVSVKPRTSSESLLKPSGGDNVDVLKRTPEGRVVSLSDHKRIARLQAALTTVRNAYDIQDNGEGSGKKNSSRNLVHMVAGAAMMQSMRDCTASRTNCCIWGSQAEIMHILLEWIMNLERESGGKTVSTCDYARQLLLEWMQPITEKQKQLVACLTLFELLQRHRSKLQTFEAREENVCLLGDQVEVYMDAIRDIVERGTTRVDLHRVKPSKLALIALETLILLSGDVAAQYLISNEVAQTRLVDDKLMHKVVETMRFCLMTLRQWHLHSTRRQLLGYAIQHLLAYVTACDVVLPSKNRNGDGNTGVDNQTVLDVLCWHWETTAPVLCTRSVAFARVQKHQPSKVLARVLERWATDTYATRDKPGIVNPEVVNAQLRYVCLLMDSIGGVKGCSKAFGDFSAEMKANFVFFFVHGLTTAVKNGNYTTVLLVLEVLRTLLLPSDSLSLLDSRDEEQGLLSQLLRSHGRSTVTRVVSDIGSEAQTELELFVADFIISRGLLITELVCRVDGTHTANVMNAISLVRTFLYQLDNATNQSPLYRHWRKQLTPGVLCLITHENYSVQRLAISCLPSLDALSCVAGLTTTAMHKAGSQVISLALGYLFSTATRKSLEVMVSWYIDACQFGSIQSHFISSKMLTAPRDWSDYVAQLGASAKENAAIDERKELQERLFSLCFSPTGWSNYLRATNTRSEVLCILLRKNFGSPRDPVLLRMLREFTACGWVNHEEFEVMARQICSFMMNVPRLTEESLNDNSPSAAKNIEGLLFSGLAPLLVLRMIPREVFRSVQMKTLSCGREDLDHLNEYIDHQLQVDDSDLNTKFEVKACATGEVLFHILARSVVDPLEFKEVKMLATESLSKFPPPLVMPFVLAHVVAFLREATPHGEQDCSCIVEDDSVPDSCGLVTAKLMVYYLNRVFSEDEHAYKDCDISSKAIAVLVQILALPADDSLVADLQRGCIDCISLILSRLAANDSGQETKKMPSAASLMNLLIAWIFGIQNGDNGENSKTRDTDGIDSRVQRLLDSMWSEARYDQLPLQVRICCCNVLLSTISRSENSVLASWKSQGFISRIALATERCVEENVVAGGLQIIFSFLYKTSDLFSLEGNDDLQLVRICFEAIASRLEVTRSESVAMNGLKVVGVLIGKFPGFIGTLSSEDLQQLIDRCLIKVRDRRVSPAVTELAKSLLRAMTPP